eukprot:1022830-Amorphochlora_amoeboformis.AAC.1
MDLSRTLAENITQWSVVIRKCNLTRTLLLYSRQAASISLELKSLTLGMKLLPSAKALSVARSRNTGFMPRKKVSSKTGGLAM